MASSMTDHLISSVDKKINNYEHASRDDSDSTSMTSLVNDLPPSSEAYHLKKELIFFFKNPIEKWREKRRFPYKFVIQVIKIILVTVQLCVFAENRFKHLDYALNNKISFSHLFLYNWDASREVTNYPPAAGPFALYRRSEFYHSFDFIVKEYANLSDAVGPYSYVYVNEKPAAIRFCFYYLDDHFNKNASQDDIDVDANDSSSRCWNISSNMFASFSIEKFLNLRNITINFKFLSAVKIFFPVEAVVQKFGNQLCSKFDVEINYDNNDMDGQLLVKLFSTFSRFRCDRHLVLARETEFYQHLIDVLVMIICGVSFSLCLRSIYRAQLLKCKTIEFFRRMKQAELSIEGRLEFCNFWFVTIIVNDILIIIGSYVNGKISKNEYTAEEWSICSLCLGTGNMLVWFGVLRYFGFFKTYNVVVLTLKRAFPKMTRFLICTLIIYAGFVFCGWLVLGPFHIKFRSISRTSENLFSLINGDDMFATFTILETNSPIVWWYSRIYMYSFVSLFIYVVLNLFLSVILDAYETIKEYYLHGFPKSDLQHFIAELDEEVQLLEDRVLDEEENRRLDENGRVYRIRDHFKSIFFSLFP